MGDWPLRDNLSMGKAIVLASPVFLLLIALEWWWARRVGKAVFGLSDAIASMSLGAISQVTTLFTRALRVGLYGAALAVIGAGAGEASSGAVHFWRSPLGWVLALVFYDLCYYWHHRLSHTVAMLWAAHVVHHSSPHFNLSTALRQTSTGALWGWVFYLPMAFAGVPLDVFAIVALIDLLYQFWVHTELVGRLGWFDRWFCAPSNHRVHHAVNDIYLDKNFGGVFMVWDHLFGSYAAEQSGEPCVYGTRNPLHSVNPVWANLEVYDKLVAQSRKLPHWRDKLAVWFKPPGWVPPSSIATPAAAHASMPATFDLKRARAEQARLPRLSGAHAACAATSFALWLHLSTSVLWFSGTWAFWASGAGAVACTMGFCAVAANVQGQLSMPASATCQLAVFGAWALCCQMLGVPLIQMLLIA